MLRRMVYIESNQIGAPGELLRWGVIVGGAKCRLEWNRKKQSRERLWKFLSAVRTCCAS